MFLHPENSTEGERRSVVGEFLKVDGPHVILKGSNGTIKVRHNGLGNYKTKYVLVIGTLENGTLNEECVYSVEDEFDYMAYTRLVNLSNKYPVIF
ncbi:hypothetical protein ENBRE01_0920 [Enteropsectra breve]|nr:hypothetical protein ENBRE01_0920 [Enteropsectra breve]